ncbi:hypothetical protein GCM10027345_37270 [Hymenobacter daeguensis]
MVRPYSYHGASGGGHNRSRSLRTGKLNIHFRQLFPLELPFPNSHLWNTDNWGPLACKSPC